MFVRTESFQEFLKFYPVVSILVAINLGLWLFIDILQLGPALEFYRFGIGNNYLLGQGEWWRIITPIFLHGGFTHALFNSFSLVLFGPALEQMLGRVKFIIVYMAAGAFGNIGTYLIAPDAFYLHLGASGAIFGLFGVYLFMFFNRKELLGPANSQIVMVILILGLFMTFTRPGVNVWAHLFGLIGGFALALPLLKGARPFSLWQNRAKHSNNSGDIAFNPNRWKRKQTFNTYGKYIFWGAIIFLVALALFSRL
ncbi:rhomboid family intramembrane serine protease [Halobacillus massiliensis]|uniref:rhomboid family intramembrane serine protease n=1 Tax=Halobacillus massiliensis TaxID=1926286 RepID=UPI0009E3567A|nr:rhomboid family intramembrane serine protease [Halobacillus massiliensis]